MYFCKCVTFFQNAMIVYSQQMVLLYYSTNNECLRKLSLKYGCCEHRFRFSLCNFFNTSLLKCLSAVSFLVFVMPRYGLDNLTIISVWVSSPGMQPLLYISYLFFQDFLSVIRACVHSHWIRLPGVFSSSRAANTL